MIRSTSLFLVFSFALLSSCGQTSTTSSTAQSKPAAIIKIKVGDAPGSVETADFNKDNIPDLAITSENDSSVTILLGNGKGAFTAATGSPFFAGPLPNDIAIGDYNNDSNPDLAFANHDTKYLTVLAGKGDGSFAPLPHSPFLTDASPHVHGIATGDFNGDHRLDLVTDSWGNNQVEILFNDSINGFKTPGKFYSVGNHPYQRLRVGDVNSDGKTDVVTSNIDGKDVTVLLGDGLGNFNSPPASPFPCGDAPFGLAVGDVNADAKPDLAVINSPSSTGGESRGIDGLTILLGDGTGNFKTVQGSPFKAGQNPNRVAIGDINGDGVNDIVTSDNNSDKIYLFLMDANGRVVNQSTMISGNHPKGIAIVDLNGDGKEDIAVCNNGDDDVSVILSR